MGRIRALPAAVLFFFLLSPTLFSRQVLVLQDPQTSCPRVPIFDYYEDPSGELTIDEIIDADRAGLFSRNDSEKTDFGYTDSAYWVRFTLRNDARHDLRWLLRIDYSWFNSVRLYAPGDNGAYIVKETGYTLPVESRDVKAGKFIFELILPEGEPRTFYVRFQTTDLMRLDLTVFSYKYFLRQDHEGQIIHGLFLGMIFILVLYNLILFIFLKEPGYLFFSLFLFFGIINTSQLSGIFYEYLSAAPGWLKFENYFIYFAAMILFAVLFSIRFLNIRKKLPVIYKILLCIMGLCFIQMALNFFSAPNSLLEPFSFALAYSAILLSVFSGAVSFIRRNRAALFFTIGWVPFVIASLISLLFSDYFGGSRVSGFFFSYSNQIGLSASALFFSIALADRYRRISREKEVTEEVNRRQREFFINLAHETKTPLTLIKNYLDEYMDSHETTRELTVIKGNIDKLLRDMVNFFDILSLRRGKGLYQDRQVVDFSEYLTDKTDLLIRSARKRDITVDTSIQEGLYLHADPLALERIVNNLFDNALKYNSPGAALLIGLDKEGGDLIFTLSDNGPGIAEEKLENIFLPYYQFSERKKNVQGIGLGLAIVEGAVRELHGRISVSNNREGGCRFTVTLPEYSPAPGEAPLSSAVDMKDYERSMFPSYASGTPEALRDTGTGADQPEEHPQDKPLILVAEDNPDLRRLLYRRLSRRFTVVAVAGGEEALSALKDMPAPEAIVSDIMMDGMDGYELFSLLRAEEKLSSVPFLFISAKDSGDERSGIFEKGAVDFIRKPFSVAELESKLEALLRFGDIKRREYEKEKFYTLGRVLAGISHEIFNPLSGITAPLSALRKILASAALSPENDEKARKHFGYIEKNIDRIEHAVGIMKTLSSNRELIKQPLDIASITESAAAAAGITRRDDLRLTTRLNPEAVITGDPEAVYQIMRNLFSNALNALEAGGEITVETLRDSDASVLRVSDTGRGMEEEEKGRVFDAFYTTSQTGKGLGLGLFIVKELSLKMSWKIRVESSAGRGTEFTFITEGGANG